MPKVGKVYQRTTATPSNKLWSPASTVTEPGDVAYVVRIVGDEARILVPRLGRQLWVAAWVLDESNLWRRVDGESD